MSGAWSPDPYLTMEEEQDLADFLKQAPRIGYGKTNIIVQKLLQKRGIPSVKYLMERGGGIDLCLIRRRCPFLLIIQFPKPRQMC